MKQGSAQDPSAGELVSPLRRPHRDLTGDSAESQSHAGLGANQTSRSMRSSGTLEQGAISAELPGNLPSW